MLLDIQKIDKVAAASALVAAGSVYFLTKSIIRPFPPGMVIPPLEGGNRSLLSLVMQHAWSNMFTKMSLKIHQTGFALAEGRMYGIRSFHIMRYTVSDRHDIEEILLDGDRFPKGTSYKILEPVLGRGLLSMLNDQEHALHRRVCNPAFGPKALHSITSATITTQCMELINTIHQAVASGNSSPSLAGLMHTTALNVIAEAAFRTSKEDIGTITPAINELFANGFSIVYLLPGMRKVPLRKQRAAWAATAKILSFTKQMIGNVQFEYAAMSDEDRAHLIAEGKGKALLDYLVLEERFTVQQVLDHSLTFMFAGHETSSNTLQWAVLLLATHPEVQQALYEELCDVVALNTVPKLSDLDDSNNEGTSIGSSSLSLLSCVIKETLRLYPVAANITRVAAKDEVLRHTKQFVPKGASIQICIFNAHRDPKTYGKTANEFIPERWNERKTEGGKDQLVLNPDALGKCGFMPFSVGARNCIGKEFAMNEMRLVLAVLVRNFELQWPSGQAFPNRKMSVTLKPREDAKIVFVPRSE